MPSVDVIKSMIASVAEALGPILDEVVFVGGTAAGLLITDPIFANVRPTDDVDMIVETASYGRYNDLLERLRKLGFVHDIDGPICRLQINSIMVDVMPTDEKILFFTNRWYPLAYKLRQEHVLNSTLKIWVIIAPMFLCTKFEAFGDRGRGDYMASSDIEDIVAVINGRPELIDECAVMPLEARQYLNVESQKLLASEDFLNTLPGILPPIGANREQLLLKRLHLLSQLSM
jgi:predicted nucleotidyltransferase